LGLGPPGSAHLLLPCAGPLLRFGFGPIIGLQLRLEPLFLPICRRPLANLHGSTSHCAFVSRPLSSDSHLDQTSGVRGAAPPRSDASADDPLGPAHPLGRGLFCSPP